MGCAFSSTQIIVIDPNGRSRNGSSKNNQNHGFAQTLLLHFRQGINRSRKSTGGVGDGTAAFWLAKTKGGNDAVLVGQLKSNGAYCRRRPSSEAKFIEHRAQLANGQSKHHRQSYGYLKVSPVPQRGNNSSRLDLCNNESGGRNSHSKNNEQQASSNNNYGLIDFQKRLERLKARASERQEENGLNCEEPEKTESGEKTMSSKKTKNDAAGPIKNGKDLKAPGPMDSIIVKHLAASANEDGEQPDLTDSEYWREWDEMSAERCSLQTAIHQPVDSVASGNCGWHDGDVSEASFVLVKKKLKVAWEHRQLKQLRKMSLLRHEHIVEGRMQHHHYHCHQITDLKMNNWIPEITQEDA